MVASAAKLRIRTLGFEEVVSERPFAARNEDEAVPLVLVQKTQTFHHPRIQAVARVSRDLTHDVQPIFEPRKLGARANREDRDLAILALVTELRYVLAIVSLTRSSVV
jgi:hypothetical protein